MSRRVSWGVVLSIVLFAGLVFASTATLADFQAAVQEADQGHGCTSIPYEDLRESCTENHERVDDKCKVDALACKDPSGLIEKAKALKTKIEQLEQQKQDLEKQKDELSDELDHETDDQKKSDLQDKIHALGDAIEAKQKEIEDKSSKLDQMKDKLSKEKDDDDQRGDRGKECVAARTDVQRQFDSATSAAGDESDDQIKPLAEKLIHFWNDGKSGHQTAIDNAQRAVDKCVAYHDQIGDALGDL